MANPALPPSLKNIQPYLTLSKQFAKRDPIVAYYLKFYALQEGLKSAKGDPEAKTYLFSTMDTLEKMKRALSSDPDYAEIISNEVVGQVHVEEAATKLFVFADTEDRKANFNKAVIKSFYTASYIFSSLKTFGELSEEAEERMKYAKWKAVEIDRCLKNGITPTPGPPGGEGLGDEFGGDVSMPQPPNMGGGGGGGGGMGDPGPSTSSYYPPMDPSQDRPVPKPRSNVPQVMPQAPGDQSTFPSVTPYPPASNPYPPASNPYPSSYPPPPSSEKGGAYPSLVGTTGFSTGGGSGATVGNSYDTGGTDPAASSVGGGGALKLSPGQVLQVQKYCKFAASALDYDDSEGALDYVTKAMKLLKTGKE